MGTNVQDIVNFNNVCDEFIAGKYILADIKIASILKTIASEEKIKNIVSSCTERYDFDYIYKHSIVEDDNGNYSLILPEEDKDKIAFIFSLLYRIDNKSIKLLDFISKFYSVEGVEPGREFSNFATSIITPFKEAVNTIYNDKHIIIETDDYQNDYFNKIMSTIQLIIKNIDSFRLKMNEKEEFSMMLNSLYIASENNDKKMVFSLMIGLDYFSKCNKRTRQAYLSLEECFADPNQQ